MRFALAGALLAAAACSSGPPASEPATGTSTVKLDQRPIAAPNFGGAEEEAILKVVDEFLLAIGNHDYEAIKTLQVAEGTTFFQRGPKSDRKPVVRRPNADFMKPQPNADPFIERYWNPVVLVRGDLAMVWAPYELRDNGQVVHCGIDGFDMVKLEGKWRVGNVLSSMEPDACDELRPGSVSAMRPRDGWKETPNQ